MTPSVDATRAVLVDGYNVLHAIPRFAPRGAPIEPARQAFQAWLAQAARRRGVGEVVLVWDGSGAGRQPRAPSPLTVLYTPKGKTADERILELCRGRYADRAAGTWVVSSDREVQGPARQLGFEGIGAMTFYRRWAHDRSHGARGRSDGLEKHRSNKPRRPAPGEVDELLGAFLRAEENDEAGEESG